MLYVVFFFFKQKTAYEMRISDWSADVCSSDLYVSWYFVETGEPLYLTFGRAVGLGVTAGAVLLFGQSLLPDTMEWDYRRTGMRREGMLSAVYTIVEKLAYAIGAGLTGLQIGRASCREGVCTSV